MNVKKWLALLLVFCVVPALFAARAEAAGEEEALRRMLFQRAGSDSCPVFCCHDYDGDGVLEAFALMGAENGSDGYTGEIWYACAQGCFKLRDTNDYLKLGAEGDDASRLFTAEEWHGGSGSVSHIWYVHDGLAKDLQVSAISGFSYDGGNRFSAYPDAFDMMSDGTGHTWKRYYYYFDTASERLREYGGLALTEAELAQLEGAGPILARVQGEGWRIGEIYYRANGVINVNLTRRESYGAVNDNLTLHCDDGGVVDTEESFAYGGVYQWANTPEIADVPETVALPTPKPTAAPTPTSAPALEDLMAVRILDGEEARPEPTAAEAVFDPADVFEFDRLSPSNARGSEMTEDGACQNYLVRLQDDVYYGGSDGYLENWVTEEGVLCDARLDLDGDGRQEIVTYEVENELIEEYDYAWLQTTGSLVVYEPVDGGYAEAARLQSIADLMPSGECGIRLVDAAGGPYIAEYYAGVADGGVAYIGMRVCRYDGRRLMQGLGASIDSMGASWIAWDIPDGVDYGSIGSAVYDYSWNGGAEALAGMGLRTGDNLWLYDADTGDERYYEARFDYTGFDALSDALAPYGMGLAYRLQPTRYLEDMDVNGGETFLYVTDNSLDGTELKLRTTLDHRPAVFSTAPSAEAYDDVYGDGYTDYGAYEDPAPEAGYAYITGDVYLRDEPSLRGQVITSIAKGSTVEFLGGVSTDERGVDWYYIRYGGRTGWSSSRYTRPQ